MTENYLLEVKNVSKSFGVVKALNRIDFNVRPNEIHALCGENGAGKSTLMNILSGVYPYGSYGGEVYYDGELCRFRNVRESEKKNIAIIHQHLALFPALSIAENIFLGNENAKNSVIDWKLTTRRAAELMERVGLHENPETKVRDLGVGKQQLVEICKAISKNVRLLILDEPTAALNDEESALLLELMRKFRQEGISCIFITHKLHEITAVADRITIIRDGETIETLCMHGDQVNEDRIIKGMVGREMKNRFPARENHVAEKCFEVRNWTVYQPTDETRKRIDNVSFYAKKGEVLGIAGLMGAGRTELAMSIFGRSYGTKISGTLIKDGKEITCPTVAQAIANSIGYVSEDRHRYGFIGGQSIKDNITLTSLSKFRKGLTINEFEEVRAAKHYKDVLHIKAYNVEQPVSNLSGGNQQKVIFGKWALADSDILFLDEPTRGIDVGAKYEIYEQIGKIVAEGKTAIVISSDMTELIGLCDRVYVMNEGRMVGELSGEQITQENIMRCIISNAVRGEAE